jgi:hypothetical protein
LFLLENRVFDEIGHIKYKTSNKKKNIAILYTVFYMIVFVINIFNIVLEKYTRRNKYNHRRMQTKSPFHMSDYYILVKNK